MRESDSVSNVRGMMHRLRQSCDRGEKIDDLKTVYRNFTSIHEAAISALESLEKKFHQGCDVPIDYVWMRSDIGMVITFCRLQLNWMVKEDNKSLALLEKIERHLLIIINRLTNYLSREALDPARISDLRDTHIVYQLFEIEPIYRAAIIRYEATFLLPIGNEFILEFFNQVHEDLQCDGKGEAEERKTMRGYLRLLRYYLEFTEDRVNDEEMNNFLMSSYHVASKMASYSFFSGNKSAISGETFSSSRQRIESDVRRGCLRALLAVPLDVSSSIPAVDNELLIIFVNCIQDNLSDLLRDEAFTDQTSPLTEQFTILRRRLSFLVTLLSDSGLVTATDHEKTLSDIRVHFQGLVRNIGSLILSCFNDEMKGSITYLLSGFIEKLDLIEEEVIQVTYCIVLVKQEQKFLRAHQLSCLYILLENLKDLIDSKSDLIMTWKGQYSDAVRTDMVLFRSFLQNIKGNSATHDGSEPTLEVDYFEKNMQIKTLVEKMQLLRNYLKLGTDQIKSEELSELLISAQATAFEMACHYSFTRYGEVHWWKVYVDTKDRVDSHMRVSILRAAVLSHDGSSTPLSDELLMGYVDCIQDNMSELVKDEDIEKMKGQFERLCQVLSFLLLLLVKHCANQEKLSDIKLRFQALLSNIGSVLWSYLNDDVKGSMTAALSDITRKVHLIREEIIDIMYCIILGRQEQESLKRFQLELLIVILETIKDLIDSKSYLIMIRKDPSDAVYKNLVFFRSFLQDIDGKSNVYDGSQSIIELEYCDEDKQITKVIEQIRLLKNYLQLDLIRSMVKS